MAYGFKTGGRKKGTPNKTTLIARDQFFSYMLNEIAMVPAYISQIEDPEKKLKALSQYMPYFIPKMAPLNFFDADMHKEEEKETIITLKLDNK